MSAPPYYHEDWPTSPSPPTPEEVPTRRRGGWMNTHTTGSIQQTLLKIQANKKTEGYKALMLMNYPATIKKRPGAALSSVASSSTAASTAPSVASLEDPFSDVTPAPRQPRNRFGPHPPFIKRWLADYAATLVEQNEDIEEQHLEASSRAPERGLDIQEQTGDRYIHEQHLEEPSSVPEQTLEIEEYTGDQPIHEHHLEVPPSVPEQTLNIEDQSLHEHHLEEPSSVPEQTLDIEECIGDQSIHEHYLEEPPNILGQTPEFKEHYIEEPSFSTNLTTSPRLIIRSSHPGPMYMPRAESITLEDSTLDAFETALDLQPNNIPTTFEQYFAMEVAARERLIDEAVRARMNKRLDHTQEGLRDVSRGIGRLDGAFFPTPSAPLTTSATLNASAPLTTSEPVMSALKIAEAPKVVEVTSDAKSIDESNTNDTLMRYEVKLSNELGSDHYLKLRLPQWIKFWTSNAEPQKKGRFAGSGTSRNWKLTWLGLILAIFTAWYTAESVMCGVYCHPTYSSKNTWQPSDPFFPWAIPTKLDQWTGEIASTTINLMTDNFVHFLDPEGLRHAKLHGKNTMGANDWWQGRSGPIGNAFQNREEPGIESDYEV